jgi:hypothetical protein
MDPTRCLVECQSLDPREPCGWRHPAHFLALTALNEFYDFSANFVNAVEGKHLNAEQLGAIQKLRLLMELTDFERRPIPNSLRAEVSPKPQLLRILGLLRDAKSLKHATIVWADFCDLRVWQSFSEGLKTMIEGALKSSDGPFGVHVHVEVR